MSCPIHMFSRFCCLEFSPTKCAKYISRMSDMTWWQLQDFWIRKTKCQDQANSLKKCFASSSFKSSNSYPPKITPFHRSPPLVATSEAKWKKLHRLPVAGCHHDQHRVEICLAQATTHDIIAVSFKPSIMKLHPPKKKEMKSQKMDAWKMIFSCSNSFHLSIFSLCNPTVDGRNPAPVDM